ncbi:hypothetical protein RchiOBHm_Chr3g0494941 [Rosa chinensis]|uniref:Uncharacterized protein n=1 Tax=Rosa chinensis TaxID=74649 RepID=A0A2P6RH45_ROSCH|nr:hypothetical protein RchiOBHm_Chr3g0494941 [Rosa chinensis]
MVPLDTSLQLEVYSISLLSRISSFLLLGASYLLISLLLFTLFLLLLLLSGFVVRSACIYWLFFAYLVLHIFCSNPFDFGYLHNWFVLYAYGGCLSIE